MTLRHATFYATCASMRCDPFELVIAVNALMCMLAWRRVGGWE